MLRRLALLPLALLSGCGGPAVAPEGPLPLELRGRTLEDELPASLSLGIDAAARRLQALPASWDTATIKLEHASALTQPLRVTLAKGSELVPAGAGKFTTASPFGQLRPRSGYTLTVDLWNGGAGATLVAEKQQAVNLVGGVNAVTVSLALVPPLSLTGATPDNGLPDDVVAINGQGFSVLPEHETLALDGVSAPIDGATNTTLTTRIPALPPGVYPWVATVGTSSATLNGFTVNGIDGVPLAWAPTNNKATEPALAYGSGEYLLAWTKDAGGGRSDVMVQRIAAGGTVVGSAAKVNAANGVHGKPAVAYSPASDRYLVAWLDATGAPTIKTQLVNANGTLSGSPLTVSNSALAGGRPTLTYDAPHDMFGLLWAENGGSRPQIDGMGIRPNNTPATGSGEIEPASNSQVAPVLTFSNTGACFAAAWEETIGGVAKVRVQVMYGTGMPVAPAFTVDAGVGAAVAQRAPALAVDPVSGDFLLTWADAGTLPGIKAQRVKFNGTTSGPVIALGDAAAAKAAPRLVYEPWQSRFAVIWQDNRRGGANWDVYGQFVGINGTKWGGNFPVAKPGALGTADLAADPVTPHGLVAFVQPGGGGAILGQFLR